MGYAQPLLIIVLATCQAAAAAVSMAGERSEFSAAPVIGRNSPGRQAIKDVRTTPAASLDRVASAVDGAESSYGRDIAMWRPDPAAPQGPMQVTEAAATDVGGGDRFDPAQNRAIGRAYLAQLYGRYRNWPDAIAAYNWGIGNMDTWLKAGRPPDKFLAGVAVYLRRVLHESGLCEGSAAKQLRQPSQRLLQGSRSAPVENQEDTAEAAKEPAGLAPDRLVNAACLAGEAWGGTQSVAMAPSRFVKKLDHAMQLAVFHGGWSR